MKPTAEIAPSIDVPSAPAPYGGAPYGLGPGDDGGMARLLAPRRLLRVAVRKGWMIALGAALGTSAAWFYLSLSTPLYMAEGLIEMSVRRPRITAQRGPISEDADLTSSPAEEVFNTRIRKFRGTRMRALVATRLRAATNQPSLSNEQIGEIIGGGQFALIRRTSLVRVSCVATDPERASLGANLFAEGAVQLSMEENRTASDNAVVWLEQQATQQQKVLDNITQAITAFRETKHIDASENERAALQAALANIGAQLTQVDNERILADKLRTAVKQVTLDPKHADRLPDTTPRRDEIVQAVSKWLLAIQERDALLARYTLDHPEVIARSKSIDILGEQVTDAIKRAQNTAEANVMLLEQQTAGLRERMETESGAASELESKIIRIQAELGALEREQTVADMSYKGLLTRIEEARISADENTATVKIVEHAAPPLEPFKPRWDVVLFLGLLLGVAGGIGIALLVETIEDHFIGTEDLERAVGLPVLGLVPRSQEKQRSVIGRMADKDRFGPGTEAFAGIRAKIMASVQGRRAACLLVTSAGPREGKTITATNLAISFARTGIKTLLVDFDLRRPQVNSVFGLPKEGPCLLDVLGQRKAEGFHRLPTPTDCPNLFVIGNHASPEISAAEILGDKIVNEFMTWARSAFELVILDSPPFGVVSDALVLAGMADGVLLVSRPGVTHTRALRHAVEEFTAAGAPLLGVVVNAVNFDRTSFLSNYDYRYGRGYHTYKYPARDETT